MGHSIAAVWSTGISWIPGLGLPRESRSGEHSGMRSAPEPDPPLLEGVHGGIEGFVFVRSDRCC